MRRQFAGIALAVLACIVAAILSLMQGVRNWQVAVKPLSVEEIRGLASVTADSTQDGPGRQAIDGDEAGSSAGAQSGLPERNNTGKAESRTDDVAARRAVELEDSGPANSTDASDADENTEPRLPKNEQLASLPSEEQLLRRFYQHTGSERARRKAQLLASEILGASIYRARQGATDAWTCSIPGQVGMQSVYAGDFDKARNYLREAVRVEKDEAWRRYVCAQLAWLEDDTQVAVALLEESCAGPVEIGVASSFWEAYTEFNALDLAVATGSEELADYYFRRYRDSWQQWISDGRRPCLPETMTWLQEHLGTPE